MVNFKKAFAFASVLVLCLSIAGCDGSNGGSTSDEGTAGEGTTGGDGATIRVTWNSNGENGDKLNDCLQAFTDETGINVDYLFFPLSWGEYFTKIQTMVAGNDSPDAAFIAIEGTQLFDSIGLSEPLNPYLEKHPEIQEEIYSGDIPQPLLDALSANGNIVALPQGWNNCCMHINTAMLKEAGLEPPPANWTYDDFLNYCAKLTKENDDGTKDYAISVPQGYFNMSGWIFNFGGQILNEDMTECELNSPETIAAVQSLQDLIHKYGYAPIPEPNVDTVQLMVDGQIAMTTAGRWQLPTYDDNDFKTVMVQYYPTVAENTPVFGVDGIAVVRGTDHYEEAAELAVYTSGVKFTTDYLTIGSIPSRKSVADETVTKIGFPDNAEIFYQSVYEGRPVQSPPTYSEIEVIFNRAISEILVNNSDVEEQLNMATDEINAILSK